MCERNDRYFAKHGYGFGSVLNQKETHNVLKTLTVKQVDALVQMILLGDVAEMGYDQDILGRWASASVPEDPEAELRMQIAACVVYLSNRLAEDIPFLKEPQWTIT